jgi:amino acid transporter
MESQQPRLRRSLTLWHLVIYGIVVVQPTAAMPSFGVISQEARGHAVTAILIAMVAMLFTAVSYGRMAQAYPSAGSAYTYVSREIHPALGYVTGWSMTMDYILNPLICVIWCSKAAGNVAPEIPYFVWAIIFAVLFTLMNLRGVKTSARINEFLAAAMCIVILLFLTAALRYLFRNPPGGSDWISPFYDPSTFSTRAVLTGTSIAVLTYIGFDGISTLSEEAEHPKRDILRATVLVCIITGILASVEVYAAQLVWPRHTPFPDVDTAYVHVAGRVGGGALFQIVNATLMVANIGSGMAAHLAAARLLYGMGRDNALPKSFFGVIDVKNHIPRNNVLLIGIIALVGALLMSYQLGAELLNFGAFIAFMGVNIAAFMRYYVRAEQKKLRNLFSPLLGFGICLVIFLNLRWQAKLAGAIWLVVGIAYGMYKTKGFAAPLPEFEVAE